MFDRDKEYMSLAMVLAEKADLRRVYPNPFVGSVVVMGDRVIGQGYHSTYGEDHAEISAIASVKDRSSLLGSSLYVNLEPCCHYGNTPPCVDAILEAGISRVIISNLDTNPLVCGKGIDRLEDGGVEVTLGLLEERGLRINKEYFKRMEGKCLRG